MKQQVLNWLGAGAGALILSAAARALPEPTPNSTRAYVWFHNFCHALLANFDKVGQPPKE